MTKKKIMGRKDKSLAVISREVVCYIQDHNIETFDIHLLVEKIKRPKRRLYDVLTILSACNYISPIKSSVFRVIGPQGFTFVINTLDKQDCFLLQKKHNAKKSLYYLTQRLFRIMLTNPKDTPWTMQGMFNHMQGYEHLNFDRRLYDVCGVLQGVHILSKNENIYYRNF